MNNPSNGWLTVYAAISKAPYASKYVHPSSVYFNRSNRVLGEIVIHPFGCR
jgi:hypothetical protein